MDKASVTNMRTGVRITRAHIRKPHRSVHPQTAPGSGAEWAPELVSQAAAIYVHSRVRQETLPQTVR